MDNWAHVHGLMDGVWTHELCMDPVVLNIAMGPIVTKPELRLKSSLKCVSSKNAHIKPSRIDTQNLSLIYVNLLNLQIILDRNSNSMVFGSYSSGS